MSKLFYTIYQKTTVGITFPAMPSLDRKELVELIAELTKILDSMPYDDKPVPEEELVEFVIPPTISDRERRKLIHLLNGSVPINWRDFKSVFAPKSKVEKWKAEQEQSE
jgi:hypothetical protein